jgi:hypothetical protein
MWAIAPKMKLPPVVLGYGSNGEEIGLNNIEEQSSLRGCLKSIFINIKASET